MTVLIKPALSFIGGAATFSLMLQIDAQTVPVIWAFLVSVTFAILLGAVTLLSPLVSTRALIEANRESRISSKDQIDSLTAKVAGLDEHNRLLLEHNLTLRAEYNQAVLDLEVTQAHVIRLEDKLRQLESGD